MVDRLVDIIVTLLCWLYFTLGFVLFFSPFYIAGALFSSRPEMLFQRLNRTFYRGFFLLLRWIAPRQQWSIDERIGAIRSSVVVCNHLSYLDPLLLIALLDRAKTIVKPVYFTIPIFGWVLRKAGYFPATASGPSAGLMVAQMETMEAYLAGGGNLFIFPEGTRNRGGEIGPLSAGALKIARYCRAPVHVLCLRNTERLFTPGRFFFYSRRPNRISVGIVDRIDPAPHLPPLAQLHRRVREGFERCLADDGGDRGTAAMAAGTASETER